MKQNRLIALQVALDFFLTDHMWAEDFIPMEPEVFDRRAVISEAYDDWDTNDIIASIIDLADDVEIQLDRKDES